MVININRIFMIKSTMKSTMKLLKEIKKIIDNMFLNINNKSVNNKTFKKGKN